MHNKLFTSVSKPFLMSLASRTSISLPSSKHHFQDSAPTYFCFHNMTTNCPSFKCRPISIDLLCCLYLSSNLRRLGQVTAFFPHTYYLPRTHRVEPRDTGVPCRFPRHPRVEQVCTKCLLCRLRSVSQRTVPRFVSTRFTIGPTSWLSLHQWDYVRENLCMPRLAPA